MISPRMAVLAVMSVLVNDRVFYPLAISLGLCRVYLFFVLRGVIMSKITGTEALNQLITIKGQPRMDGHSNLWQSLLGKLVFVKLTLKDQYIRGFLTGSTAGTLEVTLFSGEVITLAVSEITQIATHMTIPKEAIVLG